MWALSSYVWPRTAAHFSKYTKYITDGKIIHKATDEEKKKENIDSEGCFWDFIYNTSLGMAKQNLYSLMR